MQQNLAYWQTYWQSMGWLFLVICCLTLINCFVNTCVEIKILRRVRAESSQRPPRHRRDACSMAWRCQFLTARPSQDGHVIAEK